MITTTSLNGNEKLVEVAGKKYRLPKVITPNVGSGIFPQAHYSYNVVGYRCPKVGDHFLSGAVINVYKAERDLSCPYLIVEIEDEMVQSHTWVPKSSLEGSK